MHSPCLNLWRRITFPSIAQTYYSWGLCHCSEMNRVVSIEVIHYICYGILITSTLVCQTFSSFHSDLGKIASAHQCSFALKSRNTLSVYSMLSLSRTTLSLLSQRRWIGSSFFAFCFDTDTASNSSNRSAMISSYHCDKQDGELCSRPCLQHRVLVHQVPPSTE